MRPANGLHHITAIAGPAQENLDFYAGVLGMRLVKKSVNQDDPGTYHLFKEPGGVLFELATDGTGFAADEDPRHLGEALVLPPWLEPERTAIERGLPTLTSPPGARSLEPECISASCTSFVRQPIPRPRCWY